MRKSFLSIAISFHKEIICGIICASFYLWSTAPPVLAGTISLQTAAETRVVGSELTLRVSPVNRGNETAHRLTISPEVNNLQFKPLFYGSLEAGKTVTAKWQQPLPAWPPGTYTVLIRVGFTDAMGERFTALSFSTFANKKISKSQIVLKGEPLNLDNEDVLEVIVENQGASEKRLSLRVVLPAEIRCPSATKTVVLSGRSEVREGFYLSRGSARSGATYPLILLARYLEGGMHHSAATAVEITIVEPEPFLRKHRNILGLLTVFLFLSYLGLQLKGRKREGSSSKS